MQSTSDKSEMEGASAFLCYYYTLQHTHIIHGTILSLFRVQGYLDGSNVLETFETQVPAAYYCSEGCGGGLSPDSNGTIYYWNYGECTGQDTCVYVPAILPPSFCLQTS